MADLLRARLPPLLLVVCLLSSAAAWQEDLVARNPNTTLDEESVLKFSGNLSHNDHFKLLERDGNSLLIGARNIVFNISLTDLTERRDERLEWHSDPQDVQLCIMKGLDEEACHNYIRVLAKRGDEELFVCGTNSYKPRCRNYKKNPELGYVPDGTERDARGICPYSPKHNSTVTFVDGELFSGTVADFAGSDPLIYRHPLRTEQSELKQLNAPSFVGSMEYGDHVYFFFRETAVEYINCGKRVYSRVARVCKKDQGGSYKHRYSWTSFLKSRLNCSIPGDYPFYFDEIQSISTVQSGVYGGRPEEVLYAVFTTPVNSIPGSAICAFRMTDLVDTFAGAFKHQEDMNSNWLPLKNSQVPSPRPGLCVNDSRQLSDAHLNFIQSHPLMDGAVPSLHGRPLLARTSLRHRFTKIAVDPQVRAADGTLYDVLFIGTDNGRVLKAVNAASGSGTVRAEPVLIEELEVLASGAAITNLLVSRQPDAPPRLIVVTDDEVRALPLHRCGDKALRCADCVRLQDPYCGWEAAGQRCAPVDSPAWPEGVAVVQNVSHGVHPHCAEDDARYEEELYFATIPKSREQDSSDAVYSAKTLAVAVTTTCLLAMVIGFMAGWLFSRRWTRNQQRTKYYETDSTCLKQADTVALPVKTDNRGDIAQTQPNPEPTSFVGNNGKQINIVVNQTKPTLDRKTEIEPGYDTLQKKRSAYL
ncbi:semaphorin-1A-like isoform X3 [Amphibalanus amphitrite]|uniref:semaphorin-1A-like isoform X3 n=1 Tax=Amphibalanus amphitrite TaxID=1232801 RepID=UPI001C90912C|nr:semaphorin-1A-like isoform X3 [Amphibalanus amphitrite]